MYEGAEVSDVPRLMRALVEGMSQAEDMPHVVCAAMAHLNLVMIHPFRDGNGRMARCLQSLVLARHGVLAPVFMSVEEYLGRNTQEYYDVLAIVGQGNFHPDNDARPWIRFMLKAHLRQANTMLRRVRESELLWGMLEQLIEEHKLPERTIMALYDAAYGMRIRNATYRAVFDDGPEAITDATATRDLKQLVDAGLFLPRGVKRGRFYVPSEDLREVMAAVHAARPARDESDPFCGVTFVPQRAAAAFLAISDRRGGVSFAARAFPPTRPPASQCDDCRVLTVASGYRMVFVGGVAHDGCGETVEVTRALP